MGGATKELTYRIGADYGDLRRKMSETTELTAKQRREFADLEGQQRKHRQTLTELGHGMALFGVAVAAGLGMAGKAAIDWESDFAGVKKTVEGTAPEIAKLEGELRQLARTLPASHHEIAAVAEAAGQLGIKRADIAAFTKTMIDLGQTTNLTADEAATSLAQFANIMGTSANDVDRLGSALVALGNDGASTEKDILAMALRIAGSGKQIKLTESQVLGFASALSSVGINAEAGGSSISRVMVDIASAVNKGGKEVEGFAQVAGMSGQQFQQAFRDDAGAAIIAFISGLGRMSAAGEDVFGTLENLGYTEIIVRDTLLRAAGASDIFTKSLSVGSKGWIENQALADEAAKRYGTTASKLQVGANQVKDALIDVGAAVVPLVAGFTQGIGDIVKWWSTLPGPIKEVVTYVGMAAAGITILGGVALIAVPKVLAFQASMRTLAATGGMAAGALSRFGLFMAGPWGAALGIGATLLGVFAAASGAAQRKQEDLAQAGRTVADAIKEQGGVINDAVRKIASKELADKGLLELANKLGIELPTVTDALLGQGDAYGDLKTKLEGIIEAGKEWATVDAGGGESTLAWTGRLNEQGQAAKDLLEPLNSMAKAKGDQIQKDKDAAAAIGPVTEKQKAQTKATTDQAAAAKEAADALDALVKALNSMNQTTLSWREAQRSYVESVIEANKALAENGKTLDINTEKGRKNLAALDGQAAAANKVAEAAAREAQQNGDAAAGAAALTASLEASRPALIEQAKKFGMSETAAKKYAESVLGIPGVASTLLITPGSPEAILELQRVRDAVRGIPPKKDVNVGVISEAAQQKLRDLGFQVVTLPNGEVVVHAHPEPAQVALNNFINSNQNRVIAVRVITEMREKVVGGYATNAYGGIAQFAGGGVYGGREDHSPRIYRARPGTVRIFAEPETERESYIPWAMDRRPQATSVLRETVDGFGYALVPKAALMARYAYGGVTGGGLAAVGGDGAMPSPAAFAAAVCDALAGWRLTFDDGFARFVRTNTLSNGRR